MLRLYKICVMQFGYNNLRYFSWLILLTALLALVLQSHNGTASAQSDQDAQIKTEPMVNRVSVLSKCLGAIRLEAIVDRYQRELICIRRDDEGCPETLGEEQLIYCTEAKVKNQIQDLNSLISVLPTKTKDQSIASKAYLRDLKFLDELMNKIDCVEFSGIEKLACQSLHTAIAVFWAEQLFDKSVKIGLH